MIIRNIKVIVNVFDNDVNILKGVSSRANRMAAGHQPSEEERRRLVHVSGEPGVKLSGVRCYVRWKPLTQLVLIKSIVLHNDYVL